MTQSPSTWSQEPRLSTTRTVSMGNPLKAQMSNHCQRKVRCKAVLDPVCPECPPCPLPQAPAMYQAAPAGPPPPAGSPQAGVASVLPQRRWRAWRRTSLAVWPPTTPHVRRQVSPGHLPLPSNRCRCQVYACCPAAVPLVQ